VCSLHEQDDYWDICDLADANEALDIKAEMEEFIRRKIENDSKDPVS